MFRASVLATLIGCSLALNLRVPPANLEDPKHNVDTPEGQGNATTPYESVENRTATDVAMGHKANVTESACDTATWEPLKCGVEKPWSEHTPFRPDMHSYIDQCSACKIRACNADLAMPSGDAGCRCMFSAVAGGFVSDCVNTTVAASGGWKVCGAVRVCDKYGAGGQCVHPCWTMPSAPNATNPNIKITEVPIPGH